MKEDLNKLLCERERHGHRASFKPYRNLKKFNIHNTDEFVGGREGMKFRYGYDRKTFNENLNPLKGIIRTAVGRKWDKFFSELMKTFDTRSVVNQHIIEHLYDYVDIQTFMEDGVVMTRGCYRQEAEPIRGSNIEYYVDPRDGIIKFNKYYKNYKSIQRERVAERAREQLKVKRVIDDNNVLHLIDGVWFHFTLEEIPEGKTVYDRPNVPDDHRFQLSSWSEKKVTWEQLPEHKRGLYGTSRFVGQKVRDLFTGHHMYKDKGIVHAFKYSFSHGEGVYHHVGTKYHATKNTAPHKMLKQVGLI